MEKLYKSVSAILQNVNFSALWEGFERLPFALYNKKEVILADKTIPWDNRFLGNTAIEYNGQPLAIYKIDNPKGVDADLLAADIVHEMFHAFQRKKGERRYPDELKLLSYPMSPENFKIKHIENKLVVMINHEGDSARRRSMLGRFMEMRKRREIIIGDAAECEFLAETIEGSAEYVAMKALMQISPYKHDMRLSQYAARLQTLDEGLFNIRMNGYLTGVFFFKALDDAGISFRDSIGISRDSVFKMVSQNAKAEIIDEPKYSDRFNEILFKYNDNKAFKINVFLANHTKQTKGSFRIVGFDPMNMIMHENKILNNHFLRLYNNSNGMTIEFFSPVLVEIDKIDPYSVFSYTI